LVDDNKKKKPDPSEFMDKTFSVRRKALDKDKKSEEDKTN